MRWRAPDQELKPNRMWREVVQKDILDDDQDGGWVSVSSGTGSHGESQTKGRKTNVVAAVVVHC